MPFDAVLKTFSGNDESFPEFRDAGQDLRPPREMPGTEQGPDLTFILCTVVKCAILKYSPGKTESPYLPGIKNTSPGRESVDIKPDNTRRAGDKKMTAGHPFFVQSPRQNSRRVKRKTDPVREKKCLPSDMKRINVFTQLKFRLLYFPFPAADGGQEKKSAVKSPLIPFSSLTLPER